jgi:ABC-type ATPase with predicted acetyltransferase domain
MSAWTCEKCGARYWASDGHECPEDGRRMLERIRELEDEVDGLEKRITELENK